MSEALMEMAAVLGLLAAAVASLTVLAKAPIVGGVLRYVWRQLVGRPLSAWFRALVSDVVQAEIAKLSQPNGGKSLHDLAAALKRIEERQIVDTGEHPTVQ